MNQIQYGAPAALPLPLPESVEGVRQAVIDLNERTGDGTWEFFFGHGMGSDVIPGVPSPHSENQDVDLEIWQADGWRAVRVPCELAMQGIDIENNTEYYYRR